MSQGNSQRCGQEPKVSADNMGRNHASGGALSTDISGSPRQMLVVIKLPYLKSTIFCSKLSKGMGHNYYGEPA